MWLLRPPGVYRPQGDTYLLAKALADAGVPPGGAVLDICCGTGALSIHAARLSPRSLTAVDVSRRAVWAARINTLVRGLDVRVVHGDGLELDDSFDLVLANPPYVPGIPGIPVRGRRRAWDADRDGRAVLDRLCAVAPQLLARGGVLLLVHSVLSDVDKTLAQLRGGGLKAAVVARADEPFGPVMRARAGLLRAQGLLAADQRTEELVVIRGDRPTR
ncbi:MAG TPA: HemK2/MTQ2 family protein methyltransferase [Actinophytocola sp.]|jgi:release factor glutamine methyltransferase|uniref:HemK2/MTQ2 family protein methyltransferase n=1 Tax=Actinophytocola sp. TaxID=1872138 RepID=UPI002F957606